jgi:cytochrome c5
LLWVASTTVGQAGEPAADATKPVAGTNGFWQELHRAPEPYNGPPRSGEQVYEYRCKTCHGRSTQGAPMPGDRGRWAARASQGMDTLMQHALDGYNQELMPPRGTCYNCSDAELKAGILYMLRQSGIVLDKDGQFQFAAIPKNTPAKEFFPAQ